MQRSISPYGNHRPESSDCFHPNTGGNRLRQSANQTRRLWRHRQQNHSAHLLYVLCSTCRAYLLHSSYVLKKLLIPRQGLCWQSPAHIPAPGRIRREHPVLSGPRPNRLPLAEHPLRGSTFVTGCPSPNRSRRTLQEWKLWSAETIWSLRRSDRTMARSCRQVPNENARTTTRFRDATIRSRSIVQHSTTRTTLGRSLGWGGSMTPGDIAGEQSVNTDQLSISQVVVHKVWFCRQCGITRSAENADDRAREHAQTHNHVTTFETTTFSTVDPEPESSPAMRTEGGEH